MSALFQLNSVKKAYKGRTVLDIEMMTIEQGEIVAVVGPSGAGKSTLLRLLNFLEVPDSGSLIFDGQPILNNLPLNLIRRVTTVFQRPVMLTGSVKENVAYGLKVRHQRNDMEVTAALERVGLSGMGSVAASTLSGGEMQRVALARALVFNPEVLLLDEPTANLDPYNVGLIESIVKEQNQTRSTTVVLVTHNVFQARRLAKRVGLLLNGEVIELAAVSDFFDHPGDSRTKAFLNGEMPY
jgi:tungstate transport system ATP-binding protein